ncbi:hypothetical protein ACOME3_005682 [Neoechinorhynchus agilis]
MSYEPESDVTVRPREDAKDESGLINISYLRSLEGILNVLVVIFLLLGFISAVSLSHSGALYLDSCLDFVRHVKVNVAATRAAYAVFSFFGFLTFAFMLVVQTLNLPALKPVQEALNKFLGIGILATFMILMFILSSTAAAAEHKRGQARCLFLPRRGGMGAASFFGFASFLDMGGMLYFTIMKAI